ncbi:tRNA pseudouridine(38-40) synthase [Plasmodium fragile]|uniref:tRNA pseudouridine(38-40) synthase n=1 Tax=Plasmodium fragile TaxID=5857 RepID=A0A0D9QK46_PLAFR|nr:tRNA pseudouridine(38-40) synthase [Plasmodium fragile]KJP87157.1 tRNA pseudouridine(38-40) synthase [Plasmodium fragile]
MNSVLFLLYLSVLLKTESKSVSKKVFKVKVINRRGPFFVGAKSFCVIRVKRNKMALHTVGDETSPGELSVVKQEPFSIDTNKALEVGAVTSRPKLTNILLVVDYDGTNYSGWTGVENSSDIYLSATRNYKHAAAQKKKLNGAESKYDTVQNSILNCMLKIHGYGNELRRGDDVEADLKGDVEADLKGDVKADVKTDVQSHVEPHVKAFEFIGVSRTDKGVHAKEYVCQYVSYERPPPCDGNLNKIKMALNGLLNKDIRILGVLNAPFPDFNVRFNNWGKIYTYNFDIRIPSQPLERNYAWQLYDDPRFAFLLRNNSKKKKKKKKKDQLGEAIQHGSHGHDNCVTTNEFPSGIGPADCVDENVDVPFFGDHAVQGGAATTPPTQPDVSHCMRIINREGGGNPTIPCDMEKVKACCKLFIGHHNFDSFRGTLKGTEKQKVVNPFCNIYFVGLHQVRNNIYQFVIQGDRFLYHMIRIIVGTLVQVGVGLLKYEDVRDALHSSKPLKVKLCAPAQGLCLTKILFPPAIQQQVSAALLSR